MSPRKVHCKRVTREVPLLAQTGIDLKMQTGEELLDILSSVKRSWPWGIVFPPGGADNTNTGGTTIPPTGGFGG